MALGDEETTPLISTSGASETTYTATSSEALRKQSARPFDLDATTSPGDSTPATPLNAHAINQQPETLTAGSHQNQRSSLWQSVRNSEVVSLRLENSGSVARDHLASERTFLAYIRTSLAIASSGVALVQLFTVASSSHHFSPEVQAFVRPLGATAILIGISVLIIGVTRYFVVQSAMIKGYFPAARSAMGFITVALSGLVAAVFAFMMTAKVSAVDP